METLAIRDFEVAKECRDTMVPLDTRVTKEIVGKMACLEIRVTWGEKESQDGQARKEISGCLVLVAIEDLLAGLETREKRV